MNTPRPLVLAVASGGGHWVQLQRLRPAFDGCDLHFATVHPEAPPEVDRGHFHPIPDANQRQPIALLALAARLAALLIKLRPDVIVSTGAAPGLLAIAIGRLIGARTLFIDSIANAQQPSLSAKLAKHVAHLTLSQWPEVAQQYGLNYYGGVL